MAAEVTMPRLSDSMEEGTILRWLKSVGDEVKRGDELVEIETDKANMTYEATDEGVLVEIVAEEGDTLPIGEVIARIGAEGEAERRPTAAKAPARPADGLAEAPARPAAGLAEAPARRADGFAAGPARQAPAPEGAKGEVQVVDLNRLQQTIARRMAESKATVPHFYLTTQI